MAGNQYETFQSMDARGMTIPEPEPVPPSDFIKEIITARGSITITRREHPGYIEYEKALAMGNWPRNLKQIFGRWQYWYQNEKGQTIDAVLLPNYFRDGVDFWEIYSRGKVFDDVERFPTLEEAEERIKELLLK